MDTTLHERIRRCARTLAGLSSHDPACTGPCGFLCGAAYALVRACELEFVGGEVDEKRYLKELREVASALGAGRDPVDVVGRRDDAERRGIWLAGFYLDAAIHRLAAVAERLGVTKKGEPARDTPMPFGCLKEDTNTQKHDLAGILGTGRWATIQQAVEQLEMLTARMVPADAPPSG